MVRERKITVRCSKDEAEIISSNAAAAGADSPASYLRQIGLRGTSQISQALYDQEQQCHSQTSLDLAVGELLGYCQMVFRDVVRLNFSTENARRVLSQVIEAFELARRGVLLGKRSHIEVRDELAQTIHLLLKDADKSNQAR